MKTKQYVLKYKLDESDKFGHNDFVSDLTGEFISLLEEGKATEDLKAFENAVNAIRTKWNSINNKTVGQLPETLWRFFYATVIAKSRETIFPETTAKWKQRKPGEEVVDYPSYPEFQKFGQGWYWSFIFAGQKRNEKLIPAAAFNALGVTTTSTIKEAELAYQSLLNMGVSDSGAIVDLKEAKNKVMAYLSYAYC